PQPLPGEITSAWQKAGAMIGWMRVARADFLHFVPQKAGLDDVLPAFKFTVWKEGLLAKLPAPEAPFGLNLSNSKVTDAGLKQLAGLKRLQALSLSGTNITGVGLKHLAGLKNLHALDLNSTQLKGTDLKELAGLTSLQTLHLEIR